MLYFFTNYLVSFVILAFILGLIFIVSLLISFLVKPIVKSLVKKYNSEASISRHGINRYAKKWAFIINSMIIWLIFSYFAPDIMAYCDWLYLSGNIIIPNNIKPFIANLYIGREDNIILLISGAVLLGGILAPIISIVYLAFFTFKTKANSLKRVAFLIFTYVFILFAFAGLYSINYYASDLTDAFDKDEIYWQLSKIERDPYLDVHYNEIYKTDNLPFKGIQNRYWTIAPLLPYEYHLSFVDRTKYETMNKAKIYKEFLYFSGITLTTLGYGDIVPIQDNSRMLAIMEAMIGQLLLVLGFVNIRRTTT